MWVWEGRHHGLHSEEDEKKTLTATKRMSPIMEIISENCALLTDDPFAFVEERREMMRGDDEGRWWGEMMRGDDEGKWGEMMRVDDEGRWWG
jgi:hypothetical protein